MRLEIIASACALALFAGILSMLELGRRVGSRRLSADSTPGSGISAMDGVVFALLGLLVAFTFGGAASRLDARRHLIVDEANAIGTAYLRLDVLDDRARDALREKFRAYLDARLEVSAKMPDVKAAFEANTRSIALQSEIWREAVAAAKSQDSTAPAMLLLPALNEMFDITTTRTMAARTHAPLLIFVMLFGLALASAFLAGIGMAGTAYPYRRTHMVAYALATAFAIYVILDMEFPRMGMIRVDAFDDALVTLRAGMK